MTIGREFFPLKNNVRWRVKINGMIVDGRKIIKFGWKSLNKIYENCFFAHTEEKAL
jgi:hypothetical protein